MRSAWQYSWCRLANSSGGDLSLDWLARHEIAYDGLYLRVVGDYRKDVAIKNETWDHLVDDGFVVIGAWDDKQAVLDVWAERGVADLHLVSDW